MRNALHRVDIRQMVLPLQDSDADQNVCLIGLPSDNVQHEVQSWSLNTFLKEEMPGNKGILCTRCSYLLCLPKS